jgi:superfamily II DNA or RNA helicase
MSKTFRFYQRDAIENTQFSWCEYTRTLGRLGTGGGKTAIAAGIAKDEVEMGGRVLYIGDSDELCLQPMRAMREFAGIIPSMEKADREASLTSEIVVASSQTLCQKKRRERFRPDHFTKVICDEAHRGLERDLIACDYFEEARSLFLTATPYRKGMADLSEWIPDIAFDLPLKRSVKGQGVDLISLGFAPPLKILPLAISINLEDIKSARKDFDPEELATKIAPWYDEIAEGIKEHGKGYTIICFLPLIRSSKDFTRILQSHGIVARHVDGTSEDRKEIIAAFGQGEIQVLCNSDLLSTGVDIPSADCLLDLSPTMSMAKLEQRIGRVSRVLPGLIDDLPEENQSEERRSRIAASAKPHALILDVLCQNGKMARPHSLIADDAKQASEIYEWLKQFKTPLELEEIARRFQEEKEAKLIAAMEKAAAKRGKGLVDANWVGELIGLPSLKNYQSLRATDMVAATEPQLRLLQQWGIAPESVQDKGHASFLIGAIKPRMGNRMASLAQLMILRKMGIPNATGMTRKDASETINRGFTERRALKGVF